MRPPYQNYREATTGLRAALDHEIANIDPMVSESDLGRFVIAMALIDKAVAILKSGADPDVNIEMATAAFRLYLSTSATD